MPIRKIYHLQTDVVTDTIPVRHRKGSPSQRAAIAKVRHRKEQPSRENGPHGDVQLNTIWPLVPIAVVFRSSLSI